MTDFFNTVRSYMLYYLPKQKCFSVNTIRSHKDALNLFVLYLRTEKRMKIETISFSELNRQIVLEFMQWLADARSCSPASRNQRLSILRTFFDYAGQIDCTQVALELSVKKIPAAKYTKTIVEYLSENALKTLLEQPDTTKLNGQRDRFFMTLMYDTAARISELLNMKVCDLKIATVHPVAYLRGKGDKIRSVPLMPKTVEHCKGYLRTFHPNADGTSKDYLFYTTIHDARNCMTAGTVRAFMKKYGESARQVCPEVLDNIHPHQLRHTRAIHIYRDGAPLVLVGEYLGHINPVTTKVYAYADTEMKRRALEKADGAHGSIPEVTPIWQNNEEMILKLSGLR